MLPELPRTNDYWINVGEIRYVYIYQRTLLQTNLRRIIEKQRRNKKTLHMETMPLQAYTKL